MTDNKELFWELMEPEYFKAMMFCRKLTGNREQGDDLFQDALVTAFTRFPSLRDRSAFRPWIYRILVNTFRSSIRRPWYKRLVPLTSEVELRLTGDDPVEVHTARRWLGRAFQALSAREKALVTLHELEGWPISELADLYGKTEGAVKAGLFRARRKMKKALLGFSQGQKSDKAGSTKTDEDGKCVVAKPGVD
jgi:RNA polymerase sigma-70 factor (ECF subfamily)